MDNLKKVSEKELQEQKVWQEPELKSMASDSAEGATCRNGSGAVPLCRTGSSPRSMTACTAGSGAYQ